MECTSPGYICTLRVGINWLPSIMPLPRQLALPSCSCACSFQAWLSYDFPTSSFSRPSHSSRGKTSPQELVHLWDFLSPTTLSHYPLPAATGFPYLQFLKACAEWKVFNIPLLYKLTRNSADEPFPSQGLNPGALELWQFKWTRFQRADEWGL